MSDTAHDWRCCNEYIGVGLQSAPGIPIYRQRKIFRKHYRIDLFFLPFFLLNNLYDDVFALFRIRQNIV